MQHYVHACIAGEWQRWRLGWGGGGASVAVDFQRHLRYMNNYYESELVKTMKWGM